MKWFNINETKPEGLFGLYIVTNEIVIFPARWSPSRKHFLSISRGPLAIEVKYWSHFSLLPLPNNKLVTYLPKQESEFNKPLGIINEDSIKNLPIEQLGLSTRTQNCLKYSNINNLGELSNKSEYELLQIKNMGRKCIREIREAVYPYRQKLLELEKGK